MHAYADKLDTYTDAAKATAVRFVVAGDNALHGYVTYSDLRQVLGRTRMGFAFHAPPGTTVSVPHPDDAIERRDSVETSSRSSSSSSSEHTDQVVAETIAMVGKKRHRQKKIDKNEEEDEEIDDDESEGMHNLPVSLPFPLVSASCFYRWTVSLHPVSTPYLQYTIILTLK